MVQNGLLGPASENPVLVTLGGMDWGMCCSRNGCMRESTSGAAGNTRSGVEPTFGPKHLLGERGAIARPESGEEDRSAAGTRLSSQEHDKQEQQVCPATLRWGRCRQDPEQSRLPTPSVCSKGEDGRLTLDCGDSERSLLERVRLQRAELPRAELCRLGAADTPSDNC